jgi:hypothetical protein
MEFFRADGDFRLQEPSIPFYSHFTPRRNPPKPDYYLDDQDATLEDEIRQHIFEKIIENNFFAHTQQDNAINTWGGRYFAFVCDFIHKRLP